MDNQLLYDRPILKDFEQLSDEHKKILSWVGRKKKVLETACHSGYFSYWLRNFDCDVTGLEIYEPALNKAKPFLSRSILGDIEQDSTWRLLASERFDIVLFMHLLEHLVTPERILEKTKEILKPGGSVIICLPNISNWVTRWEIFTGRFNYTETGVMDRTHLRFYNFFTAQEMIEKCGYKVEEYYGGAWKVKFRIFPNIMGLWRLNNLRIISVINKVYSRIICSLFGPNLTDKVLVYKVSI